MAVNKIVFDFHWYFYRGDFLILPWPVFVLHGGHEGQNKVQGKSLLPLYKMGLDSEMEL